MLKTVLQYVLKYVSILRLFSERLISNDIFDVAHRQHANHMHGRRGRRARGIARTRRLASVVRTCATIAHKRYVVILIVFSIF